VGLKSNSPTSKKSDEEPELNNGRGSRAMESKSETSSSYGYERPVGYREEYARGGYISLPPREGERYYFGGEETREEYAPRGRGPPPPLVEYVRGYPERGYPDMDPRAKEYPEMAGRAEYGKRKYPPEEYLDPYEPVPPIVTRFNASHSP
jgi:hypothetical protein